MNSPRPDRRLGFWLAALAALAVCAVIYGHLRSHRSAPAAPAQAPAPLPVAFLSARWGSDVEGTARADGIVLTPLERIDPFQRIAEEHRRSGRYQAFQATEVPFLSRQATVTYAFWEGRLCAYHVFVEGMEDSDVEQRMIAYLEERFGTDHIEVDDGGPLKRIWDQNDTVINLWSYMDPLRLRSPQRVGFGAQFRPIFETIPAE